MRNENASIKSFSEFLENIIASLNYEDFSPDNSEIMERMKQSFYQDTAYWRKDNSDADSFKIEFKKFGDNRKRSYLEFKFKPRQLSVTLLENSCTQINEAVEFSDIWMDHEILLNILKRIMTKGMEIAKTSEN